MKQDLRRDNGIGFVGNCELVSAATADTTAMRAEFRSRRKETVGPVKFQCVHLKLGLFWFRDNFKGLKAKMDGRGVDVPLAGGSNLCIVPEGVEFKGGLDVGVGKINTYAWRGCVATCK
jgi:hypothetical protein